MLFPHQELQPFAVYGENTEVSRQRLFALSRLSLGDKILVITEAEALGRYVTPLDTFRASHLWLKPGQRWDREQLVAQLVDMGYRRESLCEVSGTFALRGGVVDVFPATAKQPLRLDFFDDELDSIRPFDAENQRSLADYWKKAVIAPARDLLVSKGRLQERGALIAKAVNDAAGALQDMPRRQLLERFLPLADLARQGIWQPGMEQLLPLCYETCSTLAGYLPGRLPCCLKRAPRRAGCFREGRGKTAGLLL